ncbi:hypothetical protein [Clostridium kluyveri]|uniref:hypothetical protein n=1 Tax=Clostridium kluyveri TaxID=1534 RepID=UPI0002EC893B|nr:hypothetical protein [Clostridium kluyveri]
MCIGLREELKDRNINVSNAALKSLKAAKKGRGVYTTGVFYKFYRVLTKVFPQSLMAKFARLG